MFSGTHTNVICVPVVYGNTCCSDLEGQDSEPLDSVVPAHSKTPLEDIRDYPFEKASGDVP